MVDAVLGVAGGSVCGVVKVDVAGVTGSISLKTGAGIDGGAKEGAVEGTPRKLWNRLLGLPGGGPRGSSITSRLRLGVCVSGGRGLLSGGTTPLFKKEEGIGARVCLRGVAGFGAVLNLF